MDQISTVRDDYFSRNEGYYRQLAKRYHWCRFTPSCRSSRDYAHYREDLWKQAKLEIDRLGATWGEIINSYRLITDYYQEYIPPCLSNNEDDNPDFPGWDEPQEPVDFLCSDNPNGEYIIHSFTFSIPAKNDGVVNIHSVLWSEGDTFDDENNIFMSDVQINANGVDVGGYNHFELRNHKRAYELRGNNGIIGFLKNDPNPAMERVENWVKDDFGNSGN